MTLERTSYTLLRGLPCKMVFLFIYLFILIANQTHSLSSFALLENSEHSSPLEQPQQDAAGPEAKLGNSQQSTLTSTGDSFQWDMGPTGPRVAWGHLGQLKWTPTRKKERKRTPEGEYNDQIFAEALKKKQHMKGLYKRQVITRNSFA